jgi:Zn finger protein HypA/HybF involved in hydrogenase expression
MTVVSLAEARKVRDVEPEETHVTGPALCLGCRHKWHAVRPTGVHEFECPSCSASKGIGLGLVFRSDELHWVCKCGNEYFLVTGARIYCPNCGSDHRPFD